MKKIIVLISYLIWTIILSGCAHSNVDEFAAFRAKTDSELLDSAENALAKKDYSKSVKLFEALDAIYPFGSYAEQGQLDIIYAYYKQGDDISALVAADRYTRLYPRGNHADYAYYMEGILAFSQNLSWLQKLVNIDPSSLDVSNLRQSFYSFQSVVVYFPNSIYAPDAKLHMAYIRNVMANRDILIAQFYMQRKAYVAAVNRASTVVQHYQGSPQVRDALVIMVKAYRRLGLTQMAEASAQVLSASYPDSKAFLNLHR